MACIPKSVVRLLLGFTAAFTKHEQMQKAYYMVLESTTRCSTGGDKAIYTRTYNKKQFTTMLFLLALLTQASGAIPPTCDSQVYCQGPLLHTVQMAQIFNDSKTFVDLKIKTSENETLENYHSFMEQTNNSPTRDQIEKFVTDNFEDGHELINWNPPDYKSDPNFLNNIEDLELRGFGKSIVELWKILARKMIPDVAQNPDQYSLMPLPNGFIIPGGRFKEIYYWDTYWIIRGLLISEMNVTAKGMIENLMYLVKKLGHVPNGSRVYYTQRSQPPLLTRMVMQYIQYTKDYDWLKKNIGVLDEELQYWIQNRAIRVKRKGMTYRMFHYDAPSSGPRPESYREDVLTAQKSNDSEKMYIELKSGAESGWDFSSRWIFDADGGTDGNLTQLMTRRVIPVDLNAILYDAFSNLAKLYEDIKDNQKSAMWLAQAKVQEFAINNVLWNEKHGIWFDYDTKLSKHRPYFYPSNITPLITNCCGARKTGYSVKRIIAYLKESGILNFPGGTPTSLVQSGEQWDYPNAWPPLQAMIIFGLVNTKNKEAENLAFQLAQTWVKANLIGFRDTKEMFEKYDAETPGKYGGGGEYVVQAGFGWTNGVILELLETYGKTLKAT